MVTVELTGGKVRSGESDEAVFNLSAVNRFIPPSTFEAFHHKGSSLSPLRRAGTSILALVFSLFTLRSPLKAALYHHSILDGHKIGLPGIFNRLSLLRRVLLTISGFSFLCN